MAGKGGLAIMIGLGKKKPGADMGMGMDSKDESADTDEAAEREAAQAVIDAMKSDDVDAFMDAHKTYMSLCYPDLKHGGSYEEGNASGEE